MHDGCDADATSEIEAPRPSLPGLQFSTDAVAPRSRFEAWRALIGQTHDLTTDVPDFQARLRSTIVGPMMVSRMDASSQTVARTPQRLRTDGQDHVVLHLTTCPFTFETSAGIRNAPVASVTVNTLARPFQRSQAAERGSVIVSLARDLLTEAVPDPERFHGAVLDRGVGMLLAEHMGALARHAGRSSPVQARAVADATIRLLAAALEPMPRTVAEAGTAIDAAALQRCRRFIERHLTAPDLSPDAICQAVGISRSSLYRLFESSGGVASYIRQRRLTAARMLLARRDTTRVSEVARQFGFANDTTFRRAYRAAFGISPSETSEAPRAVPSEPEAALFTGWLSAFG